MLSILECASHVFYMDLLVIQIHILKGEWPSEPETWKLLKKQKHVDSSYIMYSLLLNWIKLYFTSIPWQAIFKGRHNQGMDISLLIRTTKVNFVVCAVFEKKYGCC